MRAHFIHRGGGKGKAFVNPEEMQHLSDRYVRADTPEGANASAKNAADAVSALLQVARELLADVWRKELCLGDS
jgi:hypothetical protein